MSVELQVEVLAVDETGWNVQADELLPEEAGEAAAGDGGADVGVVGVEDAPPVMEVTRMASSSKTFLVWSLQASTNLMRRTQDC